MFSNKDKRIEDILDSFRRFHPDRYVRVMVLQTTLLGYNDRHSPFLLINQYSYPKRRTLCLFIVRSSLPL